MHRFHPVKRYSTSYQHRKAVTIAATVVATLAIFAGAASAAVWFTATGSTTSTETTGVVANQAVSVYAPTATDALMPGGAAGSIPITVTNDLTPNTVQVLNVRLHVTGTSDGSCTADDFTVQQPTTFTDRSTSNSDVTLPYLMQGDDTITSNDAMVTLNADAPTDCSGVTVNLSEFVGDLS